jgi:hypothetical protein
MLHAVEFIMKKTSLQQRKNAQVVTNLQHTCSNAVPTTCQPDVFTLLVDKLSMACYKLFQQLVIFL